MRSYMPLSGIVVAIALVLAPSAEALAKCGPIQWCDNSKTPPCKTIPVCLDVMPNGTTTLQIKDLDPETTSKLLEQLHIDKKSIDTLK